VALLCGALRALIVASPLHPFAVASQVRRPPPGGPASKAHCVSVTAVTEKGWKLTKINLALCKCKGEARSEVEGLRPWRASLTEAPYSLRKCKWEYEDSLGLTAHGSHLFRWDVTEGSTFHVGG
jgi:hypothetical protein